jgi:hypothetical protein
VERLLLGGFSFVCRQNVIDNGKTFDGSLECRHYLEHRYSTGFLAAYPVAIQKDPAPKPKPGLRVEVK